MRTGITISLNPADQARLEAVVSDWNNPQKHLWRAQIVLLSAGGAGTHEVMRITGKAKTCVWRWQERFMVAGADGLLRDKTRPSRIPPLGAAVAERVVARTLTAPSAPRPPSYPAPGPVPRAKRPTPPPAGAAAPVSAR